MSLIFIRIIKDLMKAFLGKAFLYPTSTLRSTCRKCSASLRNGGREGILLFILCIIFGLSNRLHSCISKLLVFLPHVCIFLGMLVTLHVEDGRNEEDE